MGTGWRLFPVDSGCTFDQMKAWTDGLTGREAAGLYNHLSELLPLGFLFLVVIIIIFQY